MIRVDVAKAEGAYAAWVFERDVIGGPISWWEEAPLISGWLPNTMRVFLGHGTVTTADNVVIGTTVTLNTTNVTVTET